jgi:hypothetical protein
MSNTTAIGPRGRVSVWPLKIESALVVEHRRLAAVHGERDAHRVVRHRERDDTWRSIRDVVRE